jgi:hypothetical protein
MLKMRRFFRLFRAKKPRTVILRRQGECHDLKAIYDRINVAYFEGKLELGITWVGNPQSRPRTRIVLGSYHLHQQVIRINRILDQSHIPDYFVAYIVYHEMLHHVYPPRKVKRRREIHHHEFKEKERQFQEYGLAKEFRKNFKNEIFGVSRPSR